VNRANCKQTTLKEDITRAGLLAGAQQLEDFAFASDERNRLIGSPGHNDTVHWLKDTLESLDGFYNVSLQNFLTVVQFNGTINTFAVGTSTPPAALISLLEYSPTGNVTAPLAVVSNVGCNAVITPSLSNDERKLTSPV
jgi:hypothetical protein